MITIKEAFAKDFEDIYPLLQEFNNATITKEKWQSLFIKHFNSSNDHFGYILLDDSKIVGFQGVVWSIREINNKEYTFCNLSSMIVKKEYRSESLKLRIHATSNENYVYTTFTSSEKNYAIGKYLGFKELNEKLQLISFFPKLSHLLRKYQLIYNAEEIKNILNEIHLKIFEDHIKFNCTHFIIKDKNQYCYIILKKKDFAPNVLNSSKVYNLFDSVFYKLFKRSIIKKRLIFGYIHYISNFELFYNSINSKCLRICKNLKLDGLIIDERYLKDSKTKIFFTYPNKHISRLYKSYSLKPIDIDYLYSELFILDH